MSYDIDQHGLDTKAFVEATDPRGTVRRVQPVAPAVVLTDPKYPHNLAQCVRALSCFGTSQLWWSGHRVLKELEGLGRLPREERMKGYQDVQILWNERPLEAYRGRDVVPVCVELVPGSEDLVVFQHPANAVYVFGPEDGSVDPGTRRNCHRFVKIPTKHCVNLSAAVYLVLYDRLLKERTRTVG
jgi:tRNA(Leu) C34 or U34 (ribose-2'-O)-methylase TrmL